MIAVDTTLFIYTLNAHQGFGSKSANILRSKDYKVASELVFAEVFSSTKLHSLALRRETQEFLETLKIAYIAANRDTFLITGALRREHPSLKLADAIHLASALQAGADSFITNDQNLVKLKIKGLKVVSL